MQNSDEPAIVCAQGVLPRPTKADGLRDSGYGVYTPAGGGRVKVNVQDPTHGGSSVRPPRTRSRNVRGSGIQPGVAPPFLTLASQPPGNGIADVK